MDEPSIMKLNTKDPFKPLSSDVMEVVDVVIYMLVVTFIDIVVEVIEVEDGPRFVVDNAEEEIVELFVLSSSGSRPCPCQLQKTTRSKETLSHSQVSRSGPRD